MAKLTDIKGIGEKRASLFAKIGVTDTESLLRYFPRGYEDRTKTVPLAEAPIGENICIRARAFSHVKETRIRKNMTIYSMIINDDSDAMSVIWYNNRFVKDSFKEGKEYIFYGKIVLNRGKREIVNPVYESVEKQKFTGRIVPVYPLCEGLTQAAVRSAVESVIGERERLTEYIPREIRSRYNLCELNFALSNIHFPENADSYNIARRRFVFEELFTLRLALMLKKGNNQVRKRTPYQLREYGEFVEKLPFQLTGAQNRVISEIVADVTSDTAMSRLVQGDVGSGKTAVAAAAIYLTVKNGYQAVMMAPTEILAKQHYESFLEMFEPFGINVVLLTSSSKGKKDTLSKIESGEARVIIGTHAVLQKNVVFNNLALAVTDEQHRFGVTQRGMLIDKGENVNVLVMTATPIPRTLALILYGDLNISALDELPPGRKPVKTYAVGENMRERIYAFLENNVKSGMQAYVVCPLVAETEKSDLENAENLSVKLSKAYPEFKTGLVHGKMKASEKNEIMSSFVSGETNILVSTTVIEVGVNVPNSNIMIIENAERFGLSQLHQLRGRVGRGGEQAYCIMVAHGKSDVTKMRMKTMCESNDGFYIAEQDLKLRGPGDFFGTRQHGLPELKIANLFEDSDILVMAQNAANELLAKDSELKLDENLALKKRALAIVAENTVMN
ncbi:MAG: ATP-dependent DNA helicase RecG [Eubacteriales bacterium]|nr:ATP-dependent DNA helicase RecG [Eubacteriales bacterium]